MLLLDEPTAGLDPLMEAVFQDVIRDAQADGRTVLLSSHILAQVEALSDRISIIRQGHIVETGTLSSMRHMTRTAVSVETDRPQEALPTMTGVYNVAHAHGHTSFEVDSEHLSTVLTYLTSLGVRSLVAHPPTLEQLLMRHYGEVHASVTPDEVAQ
ncbi:hypothetical protein [Timonella sp. A28]|uniref:hypothetical protein n=1 Tax=Timonella sp. A28 TaxID=3442640 RepID=UPI003EC0E034